MFWAGFAAGAGCMFILLTGFAWFSRWYLNHLAGKAIKELENE